MIAFVCALAPQEGDVAKWGVTHPAKCGFVPVWSSDGKFLYGAGERNRKGVINVWDVGGKSREKEFKGKLETLPGGYIAVEAAKDRIFGLAMSKDNVPHVEVLEDKRGEILRTIVFKEKLTRATDLRASPDGIIVAVTDGDGKIGIADADDATISYVIAVNVLGAGGYRCMAFDATSRKLAIGWGACQLFIWSCKEKRIERTVKLDGDATSVAFKPDGVTIAVGTQKKEVEVWDIDKGTRTRTLAGHGAPVTAAAWSPAGKWLVTADSGGGLFIWDAVKGDKLRSEAVASESFTQVRWNLDSKWFVLVGKDNHVWGKK